jgi:predicted SAM-dependent methyltransferase
MTLPASFPWGLRAALRLFRGEIVAYRRHRGGIKRAAKYRGQTDLKLNIGCGPHTKAGWLNIDLLSPEVELALDMREPMPFGDNSAIVIYSEHFLEHLDYPRPATRFLNECRRILKPGGKFSVGVPDTEWPLKAYVGPDDDGYFAYSKAMWLPEWCQTRMDDINYHFRQEGEHRFAYDYETLHRVLMEAGFVNIRRRAFDRALDTEDRKVGTLYVDAGK